MAIDETHEQREARIEQRVYADALARGEDPVYVRRSMRAGYVGGSKRFSAYGELNIKRSGIERQLKGYDRAEARAEVSEEVAPIIERHRAKLRAELEDVRAQMAQHEAQGTDDLLEDIDSADL